MNRTSVANRVTRHSANFRSVGNAKEHSDARADVSNFTSLGRSLWKRLAGDSFSARISLDGTKLYELPKEEKYSLYILSRERRSMLECDLKS